MDYTRVLLKISGEALGGASGTGFCQDALASACGILSEARATGCQLSVVCGAGNIMRGASASYLDRFQADQAGMLGTAVNALILQNMLTRQGVPALACGAFAVEGMLPKLTPAEVETALQTHILLFAGGTGSPFFSTDTAGVLKALETRSQIMIKATKVDGVYSADPKTNPSAQFFKRITYAEVLKLRLEVMDLTAVSLAMENSLPLRVIDLFRKGAVTSLLRGGDEGTLVC